MTLAGSIHDHSFSPFSRIACRLLATLLPVILVFLTSCQFLEIMQEEKRAIFTDEMADLKAYFQIPGMAVLVLDGRDIVYEDYAGKADITADIPVTPATRFPIASVTKVFSAILVHKLDKQELLDLNDPVNKYLDTSGLSDSVTIRHLLTHTSEGQTGQQFHYSSRYSLLTEVIEKSSGRSFREVLQTEILQPAGMQETYLAANADEGAPYRDVTATGYQFDGTLSACDMDYGYSASAGLFTTVRDLAVFRKSLLGDSLIGQEIKEQLFKPFKKGMPYGQGIFTQTLRGKNILWAYGQYDCHSSLIIMVPDEDLTFILMANNNLTSDPARLINGDLTSSLFAMSFLKNFAYGRSQMPLLETEAGLSNASINGELYRQKLLAQAMAETYLSRYDSARYPLAVSLLEAIFEHYPEPEEYAGINMVHTLSYLHTVAGHYQLPYPPGFNSKLEEAGKILLQNEPQNPYLHIYLADYYDRQGHITEARYHYTWLAEISNFSDNWYTEEAKKWLSDHEGD